MELNRDVAIKVLEIVDAGLVQGMGEQVAGKMCVEAAVCFALGLPHSDNPPCVGSAVRALKIRLNDSAWSSDSARTKGMRRIAIAQLGSNEVDQVAFAKIVAEEVIRQILPIALRAAASVQKKKEHKDALESAADLCEKEGTKEAALQGKTAANAAADAAAAAYADAAAYAYAAANANADAAADAAYAAADAAAAAYAYAAAYAAFARPKMRDKMFTLLADIAVTALTRLGCKGVEWLDICQ